MQRDKDGRVRTADVLEARAQFVRRLTWTTVVTLALLVFAAAGTHGWSHFRQEQVLLLDRQAQGRRALEGVCARIENQASRYVGCEQARLDANMDVTARAADLTAQHLLSDINIFRMLSEMPGMEANGALRFFLLQGFSWAVTLWIPVAALAVLACYGLGRHLVLGPLLSRWRAYQHKKTDAAQADHVPLAQSAAHGVPAATPFAPMLMQPASKPPPNGYHENFNAVP